METPRIEAEIKLTFNYGILVVRCQRVLTNIRMINSKMSALKGFSMQPVRNSLEIATEVQPNIQ